MTEPHDNELMEIEEVAVSDGGVARFAAVEVKSGEEKFTIKFECPGKLMRFDEGENQWKERGQGTAKILQRKDDPRKHMFLFRREHIGKIAAQHFLVKGMTAKIHPSSAKCVTWSAFKDFTDDEVGYPENFVLRLATTELAESVVKEILDAVAQSPV